jgi:hypothetical protein
VTDALDARGRMRAREGGRPAAGKAEGEGQFGFVGLPGPSGSSWRRKSPRENAGTS